MRAEIETYLGTVVDSTAKKISINVGLPQLDVARELNKMHTEGVVEREKRAGGGNEYAYWLVRGEKAALPTVTEPPAAAAPSLADAIANLTPNVIGIVEKAVDPNTRVIAQMDVGEGSDQSAFVYTVDAPVLDAMRAEIESLKEVNARLKANNAELEKRIDSLSGDVRPLGSVFVTIGREAKPKRHTSIEKAQRRASALIRSERESEVLVLEPIGRMVRGSEWRTR